VTIPVRALHRKLLRGLWRLKEQAGAIALVMACGIATFVMSLSMIDSLQRALDAYYERHRFAHVFAHATRVPRSLEPRLRDIPGVASVETRIVEGALLDLPGVREPANARIVSLPPDQRVALNAVHLRAGRLPQGRDQREVLVNDRFAHARGLLPGDTVNAILDGRRETLRIVGLALSPEFVYLIPPGGLLPEHDRFAVFWMGRDEMEAAFDMDGAFNDVLVRSMPAAREHDIIDAVDELLAPFGGLGAHGRDHQPSHQFLQNELDELRGMTLVVPVIFLAVSAFLLNLVLGRLIDTQRQQIAALRALGYRAREIAGHYLRFTLAIGVVAATIGVALGAWMGVGLTNLYADFFNFPRFEYHLAPRVAAVGLVIGPVAGALAVAIALRRAARLPPAEAMRPPTPTAYRPTLLERLGVHRLMPVWLRMVVRHLERRPVKTALSALGVALAAAILVVGSYTEDATDYLLDFQFNRVQQRDLEIVLADRTDRDVLADARNLPGVLAAEPSRTIGVRLSNGRRSERTGLMGLARDDGMHSLRSMYGRRVELPDRGVVLSRTLADALALRAGDRVTVEALEGRRPVFETTVAGLIDDFSGLAAYVRLDELNRRMSEPGVVGNVFVRIDPARLDAFYRRIKQTPAVVQVNVVAATERSFRETIAENLRLMRTFLIGFSAVIAFGVIYNGARVSLSERSRDLGTMRVVGFTKREVAAMQLAELAMITALGLPLGLALGYALSRLAADASASELFRMPFIIHRSTFGMAVLIVLVATLLSAVAIARRVRRLDMLAVLKSRE
jgi:putative ABC transport system permease protein